MHAVIENSVTFNTDCSVCCGLVKIMNKNPVNKFRKITRTLREIVMKLFD